jgi:hypothetical protein
VLHRGFGTYCIYSHHAHGCRLSVPCCATQLLSASTNKQHARLPHISTSRCFASVHDEDSAKGVHSFCIQADSAAAAGTQSASRGVDSMSSVDRLVGFLIGRFIVPRSGPWGVHGLQASCLDDAEPHAIWHLDVSNSQQVCTTCLVSVAALPATLISKSSQHPGTR